MHVLLHTYATTSQAQHDLTVVHVIILATLRPPAHCVTTVWTARM